MIDAAEVRARLDDPHALCDALGLITDRRSWQRQPRGVTVRCVWHDEHTPSMSVSLGPDGTVRVRCFGCHATSDALGLVAAAHGLDARADFPRVLALGAALAGLSDDAPGAPPPRPRAPEPERIDDDAFDALGRAIARLCPLDGEPDVLGYLERRGLYGACRGSLHALPAGVGARALAASMEREVGARAWSLCGLSDGRGGLAHPAHRLVALWRGPGVDGAVQAIQRRAIGPSASGKYLFTPGRAPRWPYGIEHAEALGPAGAVAFVEGFLDALALRVLCARHGTDALALGIPGTGGWSQAWAGLATARVAIVATDTDAAGERAAGRIAEDCRAAGAADVVRELPPEGAGDWADLLGRSEAA